MESFVGVRELSVLFIGNSFTQRNDLPGLIAAMAAEVDPPVAFRHERVIANGASLRQHWNAGIARAKIEAGGWTHVVLQEQSTLPVKNVQRYLENVRLFHPVIEAAGAQTVLYLTWARRHAPETQLALNEAVGAAAAETGALVVPVGPVWRRVVESGEGPELWDADGSHPSAAGSYLAACVFSRVLLGAVPVSVSEEQPRVIRSAVERVGAHLA